MVPSAGAADLDRSGAIPLHVQVAHHLRDDIRGRRLAAGTVLPSEAALCRQFGVARSVVRQALAALVAEGLIQRDPGRPPVVTAPREHRRLVQRSTGLFEQFAQLGVALSTEVLVCAPARPPAEVAAFLQTEDALLLERLRSVEGKLLAYVRTWLPNAAVPGLRAEHLRDASLHRVLGERYGLHPGRGRNRIRAVAADPRLAQLLEVPKGSPLLMLEGQGMDQAQRPLEWFTTWHRPENLVFDVDVGPAREHVQASLRVEAGAAAAAADAQPAGAPLEDAEQALLQALAAIRALRG
ncbi:GntR family transcriptional regulator [Bordetella sp. 2513F-2]